MNKGKSVKVDQSRLREVNNDMLINEDRGNLIRK